MYKANVAVVHNIPSIHYLTVIMYTCSVAQCSFRRRELSTYLDFATEYHTRVGVFRITESAL